MKLFETLIIREYNLIYVCRLDIGTMLKVRVWERYKFMMDYEHEQEINYRFSEF